MMKNVSNTSRKNKKYLYRGVCLVILVIISTTIFFDAWYEFVQVNNQTGHLLGLGNLGMATGIYLSLYYIIGKWMHAFKIGVERKANILAGQVLTLLSVAFLELFISCVITGQFRFFPNFVVIYSVVFILQSVVNCLLVIPMVNIYRKHFPPLEVLEIHGGIENALCEKINEIPYKYKIVESVSYDIGDAAIEKKLSSYDAVFLNDIPDFEKNKIVKMCYGRDKRIYFVPKISDIIARSAEELNLIDTPLFMNRNNRINPFMRYTKRFFDVALSLIALIVLSPLFVVVAIAIKLEDGGPVFYRQERITLDLKHFMILKFRSMIVDAEKDGIPHPAEDEDDRITKVGKIIRRFRIDELPQLINIIKGEMSIVGPRPERVEHVDKYIGEIPEFCYRYKVKGGLTGYAQVYGNYATSALDKLKLDLIYITNYSLLLDLQIIFETIKILVQKDSTKGFSEDEVGKMQEK
ncbi:exopolysaccharide biosynthesis polyprenyl glycosylphosphotransferase [Butyrivibrio proteoclasticus]|uniref:Exopolysaccharide biosynthesis polyprenyl glycosylphosphotransferase n=1 Tax=Butyrivibrio proteoclasticus TaxID=43305 RepID=A0A1I5PW12_9FIRM|nr:sugar transferase [Butyrivibrio proteoclasticus]SFP37841.1 exopolysaccharide biosynthesis polyprenyl glycosylphosphotransferase [Butyrivibrio proteoclasticus]